MWNKILDASLYYSFDLSGYKRHAKTFEKKLSFGPGSTALITGGTSGIGLAAADFLAQNSVEVTITGRNKDKGEKAAANKGAMNFAQLDMADWKAIGGFVAQQKPYDFVVLNAGGMPNKFETNSYGVESQFASQLFGHYYLVKELKKQNKLRKGAKIVWVTSGGMYLKSLDLSTIFENEKYDKVSTYANVKRAQVTLLTKFKDEAKGYSVFAMHPGWVDTPGVDEAIPDFAKKMKGRLRAPLQGADTILWLLSAESNAKAESGQLYFDRRQVKKHFFFFTKKSARLCDQLWSTLKETWTN